MESAKNDIKELFWNKFPVEEKRSWVVYISDNPSQSLIRFIKLIFSSSTAEYSTAGDRKIPNEKSIFINCGDRDVEWNELLYLKEKSHIFVYGKFNKIPKSILTSSNIIISDSIENMNKYSEPYKRLKLSGFVLDDFLCIDNRGMNFEVHFISKKCIDMY
jgi:hypothetical protein